MKPEIDAIDVVDKDLQTILYESYSKLYNIFLLALVIWREARGEKYDGWVAVGCSVRNRVEKPKWWGANFVEVILKRWQYSSMTNPQDKQLTLFPAYNDKTFYNIYQVAWNIVYNNGSVKHPLPGADSYFDISLINNKPDWATDDKFRGKVGRLLFYDVDEDYEQKLLTT